MVPVVIAISVHVLKSLNELGLENMRIAFGQEGNVRWIRVHEVVNTIGPEPVDSQGRGLHGKHEMSLKRPRPP